MRKYLLTFVVLAVAVSLCSAAYADRIMIGNAGGEIFGREELDLATHHAESYVNYGGMPVSALAAGVQGDLGIGLNIGYYYNAEVRKYGNLSGVITRVATGFPISAMTSTAGGDFVFGDAGNEVFVRDRTNLEARPAWYADGDGGNFNARITGLGVLSTGDIIIANAIGQVMVRSGTNIFATAPGAVHDNVNFGTPITSIAITPDDKVVIALSTGYVDVRPWQDIWQRFTYVDFGLQVNALATLSNGNVVIGLNNGYADVRPNTDLTARFTFAQFTGGAPITALAVTGTDNVAIGTGDNLVFVRKGSDFGQRPDGYIGTDGLNFNAPITALASCYIPEPSSFLALAAGLAGLVAFRRRR